MGGRFCGQGIELQLFRVRNSKARFSRWRTMMSDEVLAHTRQPGAAADWGQETSWKRSRAASYPHSWHYLGRCKRRKSTNSSRNVVSGADRFPRDGHEGHDAQGSNSVAEAAERGVKNVGVAKTLNLRLSILLCRDCNRDGALLTVPGDIYRAIELAFVGDSHTTLRHTRRRLDVPTAAL